MKSLDDNNFSPQIADLIRRFESGVATDGEIEQIERLIASGDLDPASFESFSEINLLLDEAFTTHELPVWEKGFKNLLDEVRNDERNSGQSSIRIKRIVSIAAGIALLLGLGLGWIGKGLLYENGQKPGSISEVIQVKEAAMLSLLDNANVSNRLKAVQISSEVEDVSLVMVTALLHTLNHDPSVNVRLVALDALSPYTVRAEVREGLIQSISYQSSPLVQLAMAELMVSIQEQRAIQPFNKYIDKHGDLPGVRDAMAEQIKLLTDEI